MSIAWSSLVLLVLLLPGVLFFIGIYLPEKFTRQADVRSPLGQLAGVLFVAFVVHGVAYGILSVNCGDAMPCMRFDLLVDTMNLDAKLPSATRAVSGMLVTFRWWIFLYVIGTCASGVVLGYGYGLLVASGKIRGLSRHPWVYDLSIDGLTYAYILTHLKHDERVLMYKGFLRAFGLQQDGKFSYVVLSDVTRMYMRLSPSGSETSGAEDQRIIGNSSPGQVILPTAPAQPRKRRHSLFVVEGEDVANVVFDVLETAVAAVPTNELRAIVVESAAAIGLVLTDDEVDAIVRDA
jgi:hypothetical protein